MKLFFKIFALVFAVLFSIAAALQYNDPDAFLWIIIWALAAVLCLAFAVEKLSFPVPFLMGILAIVGFTYLYPTNFQGFDLNDGDITMVELGREAFGALIIGVVLLSIAFRIRYVKRSLSISR